MAGFPPAASQHTGAGPPAHGGGISRLVCLNKRDSCMAARRAWETVVRRGLRLALFVWEPRGAAERIANEEIEKVWD